MTERIWRLSRDGNLFIPSSRTTEKPDLSQWAASLPARQSPLWVAHRRPLLCSQGLWIGESTLIYLFLASLDEPVNWEELGELNTWSYWEDKPVNWEELGELNTWSYWEDKPVNWEELGELDTWSYWEMVDHVIYLKAVELLEGASLPVWAVVSEPPQIVLATSRFSVSFFGHPGLRHSAEDTLLMSVRQAVATHCPPKVAVATQDPPAVLFMSFCCTVELMSL